MPRCVPLFLAVALVVVPLEPAHARTDSSAPAAPTNAPGPAASPNAKAAPATGSAAAPSQAPSTATPTAGNPAAAAPPAAAPPAAASSGSSPPSPPSSETEGDATPAVGAVMLVPPPAPILEGDRPPSDRATLPGAAGDAEEVAGPILPDEPRIADRPATGRGQIYAGIILAGVGAVALTSSLLLTTCNYDSTLHCRYGENRPVSVATSAALIATGALLVGGGLAYRYRYHRWQREVAKIKAKWSQNHGAQASLAPYVLPARRGYSASAGLVVHGRF